MVKHSNSWQFIFSKRALCLALLIVGCSSIGADSVTLDLGNAQGSIIGTMVQLAAVMALLTIAPAIIMTVTSFTRIVIVFSFLRNALGTQQSPPNIILISLALFLTAYIMAPAFTTAYEQGLKPLMDSQIEIGAAMDKVSTPFKKFMLKNVREKDLALFVKLSKEKIKSAENVGLKILVPAFVISEIRRGFEIGFLIYLPFVIIDMVIASILMSIGMMMMPPMLIATPFKIIFFVIVDGWNLLCGNLIKSFG